MSRWRTLTRRRNPCYRRRRRVDACSNLACSGRLPARNLGRPRLSIRVVAFRGQSRRRRFRHVVASAPRAPAIAIGPRRVRE